MHGPLTFIFWRLAEADPIHPAGGKVPPARGLRARAFRDQLQDQGRKPFQWESEGRVKNRRRNAKPDLCLNIAPSRSHRECTVQIQVSPDSPTPRAVPPTDRMKQNPSPRPSTSPVYPPANRLLSCRATERNPLVFGPRFFLKRGRLSPFAGAVWAKPHPPLQERRQLFYSKVFHQLPAMPLALWA